MTVIILSSQPRCVYFSVCKWCDKLCESCSINHHLVASTWFLNVVPPYIVFLHNLPFTSIIVVKNLEKFLKDFTNKESSSCFYKILNIFLKNGPTPASFSFIFVFSNTHYNLFIQQMNVKKCPSSLRCQDSNSRPLEHESPPITTRPGLKCLKSKV